MKTLHLVCNAHLDPVWMWDWHEGAAAALATFYSAAQLADEYDYIFCHNEVILYEYVEKYSPELFERIKSLVKRGKWHIMGGWYIQPDCMVPSGEAFVRQITLGREYFGEKFCARPTVAISFDAFGNTRGLVQILKKCGYDACILGRPYPADFPLEDDLFIWEGYDGSTVKTYRSNDLEPYSSTLGIAAQNIIRKQQNLKDKEVGVALWGVGNHGGGASRKDLADIMVLQDQMKGEYEIIHSTPERFFAEVNPTCKVDFPLPSFIKSYTSISRIKKEHALMEEDLFSYEAACALAMQKGAKTCDLGAFREAERMMCAAEFHDVLSGTCTEEGEESTVQKLRYGREGIRQEFLKAFHYLAKDYKEAKEGENPFVIFNFHPYAYDDVVETEILIPTAIASDTEGYKMTVKQDGKVIPSQVIKELSNINYDRRKRIAYKCKLNPLGTSRVDVYWEVAKKQAPPEQPDGDIVLQDAVKSVKISRKSGLMESFCVDGKEYLSGGAFCPVMFDDNADPWGWYMYSLGENLKPFRSCKNGKGVFGGLQSTKIVEDGEVLTEVESLFTCGNSYARLSYKIYKDLPFVDVNLYLLFNEQQKGVKVKIPTVWSGKYFGQVAYGTEEYKNDGGENVAQRFVYVGKEQKGLAVYSSGVYGNSKNGRDLYLTLLNGSAYCAHPIGDRPLYDNTRFMGFIEQGKHEFSFRLRVNDRCECERFAREFTQKPYSVNMYPHGDGEVEAGGAVLSNKNVVLSALKPAKEGGAIARLFNNSPKRAVCEFTFGGATKTAKLGKYEFKTYLCKDGKIAESEDSSIY